MASKYFDKIEITWKAKLYVWWWFVKFDVKKYFKRLKNK